MDVNTRLKKLEAVMEEYRGTQHFTVFLLDNGESFVTAMDPMDYLLKYGTETPKGRIVLYPHPVEGVDPLSLAMYSMINEEIKCGSMSRTIKELHGDM